MAAVRLIAMDRFAPLGRNFDVARGVWAGSPSDLGSFDVKLAINRRAIFTNWLRFAPISSGASDTHRPLQEDQT